MDCDCGFDVHTSAWLDLFVGDTMECSTAHIRPNGQKVFHFDLRSEVRNPQRYGRVAGVGKARAAAQLPGRSRGVVGLVGRGVVPPGGEGHGHEQ